jgi:hypothetical protein
MMPRFAQLRSASQGILSRQSATQGGNLKCRPSANSPAALITQQFQWVQKDYPGFIDEFLAFSLDKLTEPCAEFCGDWLFRKHTEKD